MNIREITAARFFIFCHQPCGVDGQDNTVQRLAGALCHHAFQQAVPQAVVQLRFFAVFVRLGDQVSARHQEDGFIGQRTADMQTDTLF